MSAGDGLSKARLSRLHNVMERYVESGEVPGLVTLVCRRGQVHVDELGFTAMGGNRPMQRDTIFRIASMTKPLAAAAAMILIEQCKLRLDDPIHRWLPEVSAPRVLKQIDAPIEDTLPALRPITVRDLLTFRMGFGLIVGPSDRYPIQRSAAAEQLGAFGLPQAPTPHYPDEWMRRFATLPLMHQPGERWMYHTSFEVLGVLLARVTGQPLETWMRENLFGPLGMKDTGFSVPAEKLDRLANCYEVERETGRLKLHDESTSSRWASEPVFPSAGGGLVSTVDDYLAFSQMMLNHGRHGNRRVLSRLSVEWMRTDQLTPEQKAASDFVPGFWTSRGWGIGVCVVTRRDGVAAVPQRFGWDGGYGTSWCSDPQEDMVALLMTQRLGFPLLWPLCQDFWVSVYQAIDD